MHSYYNALSIALHDAAWCSRERRWELRERGAAAEAFCAWARTAFDRLPVTDTFLESVVEHAVRRHVFSPQPDPELCPWCCGTGRCPRPMDPERVLPMKTAEETKGGS